MFRGVFAVHCHVSLRIVRCLCSLFERTFFIGFSSQRQLDTDSFTWRLTKFYNHIP